MGKITIMFKNKQSYTFNCEEGISTFQTLAKEMAKPLSFWVHLGPQHVIKRSTVQSIHYSEEKDENFNSSN